MLKFLAFADFHYEKFYNTPEPIKCFKELVADEYSFHFNLESNGRLEKMMKYEDINNYHSYLCLYDENEPYNLLIEFGCITIRHFNGNYFGWYSPSSDEINFNGLEYPLTKGFVKKRSGCIIDYVELRLKRLLFYEMK